MSEEYTCAYGAVSVTEGVLDKLVLPYFNDIFGINQGSQRIFIEILPGQRFGAVRKPPVRGR